MSQPDPRAVAKGIISGWYQSTEAAAGFTLGIAEHEWQRLEAIIAAVLADAERRGMERAAKEVPTNWCDPLLTGPKGVAKADTAFTCRSIEQLLRGIQARIRAQAQADKER